MGNTTFMVNYVTLFGGPYIMEACFYAKMNMLSFDMTYFFLIDYANNLALLHHKCQKQYKRFWKDNLVTIFDDFIDNIQS